MKLCVWFHLANSFLTRRVSKPIKFNGRAIGFYGFLVLSLHSHHFLKELVTDNSMERNIVSRFWSVWAVFKLLLFSHLLARFNIFDQARVNLAVLIQWTLQIFIPVLVTLLNFSNQTLMNLIFSPFFRTDHYFPYAIVSIVFHHACTTFLAINLLERPKNPVSKLCQKECCICSMSGHSFW